MRSDTIFVCAKYDEVKHGAIGGDRGSGKLSTALYTAAKRQNDHKAANEISKRFFTDRVIDRVIDEIEDDIVNGKRIIVVHPQPCFNVEGEGSGDMLVSNAIPYACANLVASVIGADLNLDIIQAARPGRTRLNKFQRFLYQPSFEGAVDSSATYVLIDDNCTLGGTLAMLRTHIVASGGTVGAVCTLCSPEGKDRRFSATSDMVKAVRSQYGDEVDDFFLKEIGHNVSKFTQNEALTVAAWFTDRSGSSKLDRLREKIGATRLKG
jgi:hypothetical protein